jgi:adenine phosphoribosyltransferase
LLCHFDKLADNTFIDMTHSQTVEQRLKSAIRDIPDFPKPGIIFKDISPIFLDHDLCDHITESFCSSLVTEPDIICAIESRGFFFGILIAARLKKPLLMVRKKGKLPGEVVSVSYDLEYNQGVLEIQKNAITGNPKVLIHDDVLATGGTAAAAAKLIQQEGGSVINFSFLMELEFLNGRKNLDAYPAEVVSLVKY